MKKRDNEETPAPGSLAAGLRFLENAPNTSVKPQKPYIVPNHSVL
jgi:hypothetical protein